MKFSYDSETNMGYIYISGERIENTCSFHGVNIDVNEHDDIVGIELFGKD